MTRVVKADLETGELVYMQICAHAYAVEVTILEPVSLCLCGSIGTLYLPVLKCTWLPTTARTRSRCLGLHQRPRCSPEPSAEPQPDPAAPSCLGPGCHRCWAPQGFTIRVPNFEGQDAEGSHPVLPHPTLLSFPTETWFCDHTRFLREKITPLRQYGVMPLPPNIKPSSGHCLRQSRPQATPFPFL